MLENDSSHLALQPHDSDTLRHLCLATLSAAEEASDEKHAQNLRSRIETVVVVLRQHEYANNT